MEFMAKDIRSATRAIDDNGTVKLVTKIQMEANLSPEVIAELARCQREALPAKVTLELEAAQLSFGQKI